MDLRYNTPNQNFCQDPSGPFENQSHNIFAQVVCSSIKRILNPWRDLRKN